MSERKAPAIDLLTLRFLGRVAGSRGAVLALIELRLDLRLGLLVGGLGLRHASVLLLAFLVVAALLRDFVLALGLGVRGVALGAHRLVVLGVQLGLGGLLLGLRF